MRDSNATCEDLGDEFPSVEDFNKGRFLCDVRVGGGIGLKSTPILQTNSL